MQVREIIVIQVKPNKLFGVNQIDFFANNTRRLKTKELEFVTNKWSNNKKANICNTSTLQLNVLLSLHFLSHT